MKEHSALLMLLCQRYNSVYRKPIQRSQRWQWVDASTNNGQLCPLPHPNLLPLNIN
jgi:hypothetical protein